MIVEAPEEQLSSQQAEVEERMRAGRKRAKKLRHRMASRCVWGVRGWRREGESGEGVCDNCFSLLSELMRS